MNFTRDNVISFANKTSSSFYSTSSFNKRLLTVSTISNSKTFDKHRRISLKNFHKNYLKKKLLLKEKYFPTETSRESVNNQFFLTKIFSNNDLLLENEENNESYKPLSKDSFLLVQPKKYNVYPKISSRKEDLLDFNLKLRNSRKARIICKVLNKEKENFLENNKGKIEQINIQISEIHYAKNLLDKYSYQLNKYCKYLSKELEKEQLSLNKIILKESGIRNLVKNLKEKVNNKKLEIIEIEQFRNFLLCVKYKVTKIKDLPQNIITIYQLEKYLPQEKQPKKIMTKSSANFGRKSIGNFSKKKVKLSKRISAYENKNNRIEKFNSIIKKDVIPPPIIYNSLEEYELDIQNIKIGLLKSFTFNNEQKKELKLLRSKKNELISNQNIPEKTFQIKNYENDLKIKKNENKRLHNTLISIGSLKSQSKLKKNILNKLISIMTNLSINIEKEFDCPNFYHVLCSKQDNFLCKGLRQDTVLFCLFILEQILISRITKIKTFNSKKDLIFISDVKNKLESEKRINHGRNKRKLEKERIIKLNNNIFQKMNKILYLPRRKVNIINKFSSDFRSRSEEKKRNNGKKYKLDYESILYN